MGNKHAISTDADKLSYNQYGTNILCIPTNDKMWWGVWKNTFVNSRD